MSEKNTRRRKNQRTDGRYMVQMTVGTKPDGKPIRKTFYGSTKKEAMEKREAYKKRMDAGIADSDYTVAEWIDQYLEIYRPKILTKPYICAELVPYRRLKKSLGTLKLARVREADLQNELNTLQGMSNSTIRCYSAAIRGIFYSARQNKLIQDDPSAHLSNPAGTSGTHRALTRPEVVALTECWHDFPAGLWAMLMLWAGIRRGEMLALDWNSVDMERKILHIRASAIVTYHDTILKPGAKSEAGVRSIPICAPLWQALDTIPPNQRIGLICSEDGGVPLCDRTLRREWARLNRKLSRELIRPIRMHDLRHTFATMLYEAGIPVKAAQYYMGHSSIEMTMGLYTHLSAETQQVSAAALIQYLDGITHGQLPNPML